MGVKEWKVDGYAIERPVYSAIIGFCIEWEYGRGLYHRRKGLMLLLQPRWGVVPTRLAEEVGFRKGRTRVPYNKLQADDIPGCDKLVEKVRR